MLNCFCLCIHVSSPSTYFKTFFLSKIDAFDYDEQGGSISNRRTAVKINPSHGVS